MNTRRTLFSLLLGAVLLCSCGSPIARSAPGDGAEPDRTTNNQPLPAATAAASAAAEEAAAPAAALPETCTLLSSADLARVLPDAFGEGEAGEVPAPADAAFVPKDCSFRSGDKLVVLTLFPASSVFQDQKQSGFGPTLNAVEGLGDEAFWNVDANELWVVRGDTTVALGFVFMESSPALAAPLMQQVLARLG